MNIKQLIEGYERISNFCETVSINKLIQELKQLDGPEKVKVPQFVADWIEYFKKCSGTLYGSTVPFSYYGRAIADDFEGDVTEALGWIRDNSEVYARAWLDGYEVEEEKRYFVKAKSIGDHNNYLKYNTNQKHWYFGSRFIYVNDVDTKIHHTRKQLEDAGFGWVFDCPGVEVTEVEE